MSFLLAGIAMAVDVTQVFIVAYAPLGEDVREKVLAELVPSGATGYRASVDFRSMSDCVCRFLYATFENTVDNTKHCTDTCAPCATVEDSSQPIIKTKPGTRRVGHGAMVYVASGPLKACVRTVLDPESTFQADEEGEVLEYKDLASVTYDD